MWRYPWIRFQRDFARSNAESNHRRRRSLPRTAPLGQFAPLASTKTLELFLRPSVARETESLMSALDPKLRKRSRQRSVHRCDFFIRKLLPQTGFGPAPGLFRLRFVDSVGRNRKVRQDGDAPGANRDEAFAGCDEHIAPV